MGNEGKEEAISGIQWEVNEKEIIIGGKKEDKNEEGKWGQYGRKRDDREVRIRRM